MGMLTGFLTTTIVAALWLLPNVSIKKHGEVIFTDFPMGIGTISFENDLIHIGVTNFVYERDVPFEINFIAACNDPKYGSLWGMPYKGAFFFEYTNASERPSNCTVINDVHDLHPLTKIKKLNKYRTEQTAACSESKSEGGNKPKPEAEDRSK